MTEESANQTTSGHDAFVSYASQEVAAANSIVEHLEQIGLKCWIAPRDVKPGAQYADAIVDQYSTYLKGTTEPGKSQYFKISCGCKDTPPADHDSYKLEVFGGY
jgi:hypothetical protein